MFVVTLHPLAQVGNTALLMSAYGGSVELVEMLLDKGSSLNEVNSVSVYLAIGSLKNLLFYRAVCLVPGQNGCNAMHMAADGGKLEVIKFLSQKFPSRVHERDSYGNSMLHYAARKGHCKVACYLIEKLKLDPQDRDKVCLYVWRRGVEWEEVCQKYRLCLCSLYHDVTWT